MGKQKIKNIRLEKKKTRNKKSRRGDVPRKHPAQVQMLAYFKYRAANDNNSDNFTSLVDRINVSKDQ